MDEVATKPAAAGEDRGESFGFAAAEDVPIPYMQRVRDYYLALGYGAPYVWAQQAEVPFQPLTRPLNECRVALITTAAPYRPDSGDQDPGAPYNAAAKFYSVYSGDTDQEHDLRNVHVAIDRDHHAQGDQGCYFPLVALRRAAARGRIGELSPRFFGLPTNRSHRVTLETDIPELVARCKADKVEAAVLVPNCPVCHQSVSLAASRLEASGIATVVLGCAKDIVEHVGVPRLLFSDFPLGNAAGRPHDVESQDATLELALKLLEGAPAARTTVQSPLRWRDDPSWKRDYMNLQALTPDEIARRRAEFDRQKAVAKGVRDEGGSAVSESA